MMSPCWRFYICKKKNTFQEMLHDIQMCFHRFSVNVPCVRMLSGVALLLLLHTKEVGLGGGSEPRRPISLQLPGLHRR